MKTRNQGEVASVTFQSLRYKAGFQIHLDLIPLGWVTAIKKLASSVVFTSLYTDTDNGVLEKLACAYMIIMLEKLCIEAVSSNSSRYSSRVCTIKPKLLLGNKEPFYLTLRKQQQDMLISVMDWIPKTYWKL